MLVTDRRLCRALPLEKIVDVACRSGVDIVQFREKDLPSKGLLRLALRLRKITRKHSAMLLINDRLDIALLSKANGIHSPANGIQAKYIKKFSTHLAGKSIHSLQDGIKAETQGYDYVIFGPVFRTASKTKYGKPQGLQQLNEVCKKMKIPVYAIGGVTPKRVANCIKAGAAGVTVMSAILKSRDIGNTVRNFKTTLKFNK